MNMMVKHWPQVKQHWVLGRLWLLTVIFSLFVVSYSDRMLVHDWRSLSEPWLLWINTAILIFITLNFSQGKNLF